MELTVKLSDDYRDIEVGGFEGDTCAAYWFGRECVAQNLTPYVFDFPHSEPDFTIEGPHCLHLVNDLVSKLKQEVP